MLHVIQSRRYLFCFKEYVSSASPMSRAGCALVCVYVCVFFVCVNKCMCVHVCTLFRVWLYGLVDGCMGLVNERVNE